MKLGGTTLPEPQGFEREWYKLVKAGRVASGKMTLEVIARKRKFTLSYNTLTGSDFATLVSVIDTNDAFLTFEFPESDGSTSTCTVYTGALKSLFYMNTASKKLYKDISFALIEQ